MEIEARSALDEMLRLADPLKPQPQPRLRRGLSDEMGVSLNLPFSTMIDGDKFEINNPEEVSTQMLISMRRTDAQVRALMRLMTLPIRAAIPQSMIEPAEGGQEEAELIEKMFYLPHSAGGMWTPFRQVISQALLAIVDGFSCFELVYKIPTDGELAGMVTLHKIARRPPTTCTFVVNKQGDYDGFKQRTSLHGETIDVHIKGEDSFYFAAQEEENPYYGVSYFLPAWWHHDKKVKVYYLAHLAAQMAAVPGRVGMEPPNASRDQKLAFMNALKDYGLGAAIRLPIGFEFEENQREPSLTQFIEFVNHHNTMMSKSVLAQDELDEGERENQPLFDTTGGASEMFILQLTSIMEDLADKVNSLIIPKFIDWNFGSGKYPTWKFSAFTDDQREAVRRTFEALSVATVTNVSPDFLYEVEKGMAQEIGFDLDYEGEMLARFEKIRDAEVELLVNPPVPPKPPAQPNSISGGNPNTVASAAPALLLSDVAARLLKSGPS